MPENPYPAEIIRLVRQYESTYSPRYLDAARTLMLAMAIDRGLTARRRRGHSRRDQPSHIGLTPQTSGRLSPGSPAAGKPGTAGKPIRKGTRPS